IARRDDRMDRQARHCQGAGPGISHSSARQIDLIGALSGGALGGTGRPERRLCARHGRRIAVAECHLNGWAPPPRDDRRSGLRPFLWRRSPPLALAADLGLNLLADSDRGVMIHWRSCGYGGFLNNFPCPERTNSGPAPAPPVPFA